MCSVSRGQKRALALLELELKTVVSCHAGSTNWVFCENNASSQAPSHLFNSEASFLNSLQCCNMEGHAPNTKTWGTHSPKSSSALLSRGFPPPHVFLLDIFREDKITTERPWGESSVSKASAVQEGPNASIYTKTQVPQNDSPGAGETLETGTGRSLVLVQGQQNNNSNRRRETERRKGRRDRRKKRKRKKRRKERKSLSGLW